MPKFRNIRVKMANGKSRIQRAQVLASGKLKFVKNKARSAGRSVKRRASTAKRRVTRRKTTKSRAPVRRNNSKRSKGNSMVFGGIKSTLNKPIIKKVLMAAGLVSVLISVLSLVSPRAAATVARPEVRAGIGFVSGDFVGGISQFLLAGGAQQVGSLLGGGGNGGNGGGANNGGFA